MTGWERRLREKGGGHCSIFKNLYISIRVTAQPQNNYCKQMRPRLRRALGGFVEATFPIMPQSLMLFKPEHGVYGPVGAAGASADFPQGRSCSPNATFD